MAIIVKGNTKIVFGVQEPKPIRGAPAGRQRIRMRNKSGAKLFVKTADGIRCFIIEDGGDHWFVDPKLEQGRNVKWFPEAAVVSIEKDFVPGTGFNP